MTTGASGQQTILVSHGTQPKTSPAAPWSASWMPFHFELRLRSEFLAAGAKIAGAQAIAWIADSVSLTRKPELDPIGAGVARECLRL